MKREELENLLSLGESYKTAIEEKDKIHEMKKKINEIEESKNKHYEEERRKKTKELHEQLRKIKEEITFFESEINKIKRNYFSKNRYQFLNLYYKTSCISCDDECQVIILDCYNSPEYSERGLSIEVIEEKLIELYKDYNIIRGLLTSLCNIFGHQYEQKNFDIYYCPCCYNTEFTIHPNNLPVFPEGTGVTKNNNNYFLIKPQDNKFNEYIILSDDMEENIKQLRKRHKYIISTGNVEEDIKLLQEEYQERNKKKIRTIW